MKKLRLSPSDIKECSLLTIEEASMAPKNSLRYPSWSWLNTPGTSKYYTAGITKDGEIDDRDGYVFNLAAVRPSLRLSHPLVESGNKYVINGTVFTAVSDSILLYSDVVMKCPYTNGPTGNDYEHSKAKSVTDDWFAEFCLELSNITPVSETRLRQLITNCVELLGSNEITGETPANRLITAGFTSDELYALSCPRYSKLLDDLIELNDDDIGDGLSKKPSRRIDISVWEEMIKRYSDKHNLDLDIREVMKMASELFENYKSDMSYEENISLLRGISESISEPLSVSSAQAVYGNGSDLRKMAEEARAELEKKQEEKEEKTFPPFYTDPRTGRTGI